MRSKQEGAHWDLREVVEGRDSREHCICGGWPDSICVATNATCAVVPNKPVSHAARTSHFMFRSR